MDILLISDDRFLCKALKYSLPEIQILGRGNALKYLKNLNNNKYCVLVDDRIPDLKLYTLKSHCRIDDYLVLLSSCSEKSDSDNDAYFDKKISLYKSKDNFLYDINTVVKNLSSKKIRTNNNRQHLNAKEIAVLGHLLENHSLPETSKSTKLSMQSVYRYREIIVRKYGFSKFSFFYSAITPTQEK